MHPTTASLTVDMKKYRLRISNRTFELIDSPEFFRFLVNPEDKGIILESCPETSKGAYQLSKASFHKGSYEFTSIRLIKEIMQCAGFTGPATIRLAGQRIRGQAALFFRMEQQPEYPPAS